MKNRLIKRIIPLFLALLLLASALPALAGHASAGEENRTVRVGFFAFPGYHEIEDGVPGGYGYEFLMLLRRYTNLNYEFVGYENSWEEMQQMLLDGEIDLVTSARKTPAREVLFDFSEPIGSNSAQINVRADDARFTPGDFAALNGIAIGELAGNSRNADLERFAEEKGFVYRKSMYDTAEELEQALAEGKLNAISTSSLRKSTGEKTVAEFAPEDFYVIVKKGNTALLDEINYGITQMDLNEGNWRDDLMYRNYRAETESNLAFTQRELEYIRAVQSGEKTITVSAQPDRDPYSFVENGVLTGIIPDYFAHLMEMAGLPYTTLVAADRDEFQTWTMTNHTDVIMDCRYGSSPSMQLDFGLVTEPYMQLTTSRVTKKGFNGTVRSIATVDSQGTDFIEEDIAGDAEYLIVATREEAMRAVEDGKADACYVYTYMAEKFINSDPESTLQATVLKEPVYSEYIYVSPNADHALCSILNKCIKADGSGTLDEYIRQYTTMTFDSLTLEQYLKLHPVFALVCAALLALIAVLTAVVVFRARTVKMKNAQISQEKVQQQKLSEALTFTNYFLDTYVSAYYIDLDTCSCQIYKRTADLEKDYPIVDSYYDSLREYILRNVHPDDRKALLDLVRPEELKARLKEQPELIRVFRDRSGGTEKQYRMQIIRGADEAHAAFGFVDITEEVRREDEQQRQIRMNFDIIEILASEYTSVYYIDLTTDGLTPYTMNESTESVFGKIFRNGITYSDAFRLYVDEQVLPEDRAMMLEAGSIRSILRELNSKKTFITTYRDAAGHFSEMKFVKVGDETGKPFAVALGFADRDEELRAKQEAERIRQRNIDIIEILASEYSSVYYIDLTTDELDPYTMNEETESEFGRIFRSGIKYSDAFRLYVDTLVYAEDRAMMLEAGSVFNILKELADKKTFLTTYRSENNGDPHYCEMKFVKVGDEENPQAVALGFADKDEELRAELRRREIAARDAAVIAGLSDDFGCVVYVEYETGSEVHYRFDPLLSANIPGWEAVTNFDERMTLLAETLCHPDDAAFFRAAREVKASVVAAVKRDGVYYRNFRVVIGGDIFYYQLKMVRDENSENHVIAGFRSVDETVKREMEYQEKLEAANRSKTDFLFNMSHDIRTPMNAIIGFTQLAKKHIDDPERTVDSLNKIESSGNHLLELINEVLDMSRVEAGKLHSELKTVNVSEAAMRLVTICRESASQRGITLSYRDLGIMHPMVIADELHINQIIMNILGNAVKYTMPGGSVCYTVEETDSEVPGYGKYILSVEDTGIGMSPEFLEHIFESFSREDKATTSEIQGTGLGMAIVKRLVDYMDGTIGIESEPGKGTRVTVTLHMQLAGEAADRTAPTQEEIRIDLRGKKALLVEDNELNREIAVDILEEQGVVTDEAVNGVEAVNRVRERGADAFDFVLMDIQMPLMDGYEATAEIRKLPGAETLPIIALSANAFEEDKKKSLEAGMNDHVAKPIVIAELMAALAKYVK